jgi:18S rRNA (adenine1779-N6/adenine1780-N6)-dimethyltransferase
MPRATSERFSRAHQPSAKSKASNSHGQPSSSSVRNPIFNTERFGQHILKNPSIAQEYVAFSGQDMLKG